jgi:DNA-binding XRE family transcriptional regulator
MAKYNDWIQGDGLIKVRGWARKGLTNDQIAENIGINRDTLYDWQKKYPDFSDALKSTKEITVYEVEDALYKAAMGYFVEETITTVTSTGKSHTEIRKKWIAPNTTAQIFFLKNKDPENWRERNDITLSETNGVLESLMALHKQNGNVE